MRDHRAPFLFSFGGEWARSQRFCGMAPRLALDVVLCEAMAMNDQARAAFSPHRTQFGRERHAGGSRIAWHPHGTAYAAIVLRGGYWEAGDEGRHRVEAGDVLLHARFDGHANGFGRAASEVLNLPIEDGEVRFVHGK